VIGKPFVRSALRREEQRSRPCEAPLPPKQAREKQASQARNGYVDCRPPELDCRIASRLAMTRIWRFGAWLRADTGACPYVGAATGAQDAPPTLIPPFGGRAREKGAAQSAAFGGLACSTPFAFGRLAQSTPLLIAVRQEPRPKGQGSLFAGAGRRFLMATMPHPVIASEARQSISLHFWFLTQRKFP
jgi:hypothetical protein